MIDAPSLYDRPGNPYTNKDIISNMRITIKGLPY